MHSFILYKFKEDSNTILFREKYFTIKNNITKKRLIKFIINVIRGVTKLSMYVYSWQMCRKIIYTNFIHDKLY